LEIDVMEELYFAPENKIKADKSEKYISHPCSPIEEYTG
jgi:hypothetical protein